jgi:uncharacterized membrane protein (UPF0127 family)
MLPESILFDDSFNFLFKNKKDRFAKIKVKVANEDKSKAEWVTALLPHSKTTFKDKKISRLFIPLKKEIRKKLGLSHGEKIEVDFTFVL